MTLAETLILVWQHVLADDKDGIELREETYRVTMFRAKKLRSVEFNHGTLGIIGIEHNPATGSRWALLAQQGNRKMQFRCKRRYVANVCDGKLPHYPASLTLKA